MASLIRVDGFRPRRTRCIHARARMAATARPRYGVAVLDRNLLRGVQFVSLRLPGMTIAADNEWAMFHLYNAGVGEFCAVFNEMRKSRDDSMTGVGNFATGADGYATVLPLGPASSELLCVGQRGAAGAPAEMAEAY